MSIYPKVRPKSGNDKTRLISTQLKEAVKETLNSTIHSEDLDVADTANEHVAHTLQDEAPNKSVRPNSSVGANNPGIRLLDACFDDVAYARYLLTSRLPGDRNIRNKVNWKEPSTNVSLLHSLAYSDLVRPTKLLLEFQADPNIRNNYDETPLHWCAKMNSVKTAEVLLQHPSILINAQDAASNTALHYAASLGNLEIVALLLSQPGLDISKIDGDNQCAFEVALQERRSNASVHACAVLLLRYYIRHQLIDNPSVVDDKLRAKILQFQQHAHYQAPTGNSSTTNNNTAAAATYNHNNNNNNRNDDVNNTTNKSPEVLPRTTIYHNDYNSTTNNNDNDSPVTFYDQVKKGEILPSKSHNKVKTSNSSSNPLAIDVSFDKSLNTTTASSNVDNSLFFTLSSSNTSNDHGHTQSRSRSPNFAKPTSSNTNSRGNSRSRSASPLFIVKKLQEKQHEASIFSLSAQVFNNTNNSHNNQEATSNNEKHRPFSKIVEDPLDYGHDSHAQSKKSKSRSNSPQRDRDRDAAYFISPTNTTTSSPSRFSPDNKKGNKSQKKKTHKTSNNNNNKSHKRSDHADHTQQESELDDEAISRQVEQVTKQLFGENHVVGSITSSLLRKSLNSQSSNGNSADNNTNTNTNSMVPEKVRRHASASVLDISSSSNTQTIKTAIMTNRHQSTGNLLDKKKSSTHEDDVHDQDEVARQDHDNDQDEAAAVTAPEKKEFQSVAARKYSSTKFIPFYPINLLSNSILDNNTHDADAEDIDDQRHQGRQPQSNSSSNSSNLVCGHLDIILSVEHCCDCDHQSFRHDERQYIHAANKILAVLVKALLVDRRMAVRVFALRSKPMTVKRIGAFEVTATVCVVPPLPSIRDFATANTNKAKTPIASSNSVNNINNGSRQTVTGVGAGLGRQTATSPMSRQPFASMVNMHSTGEQTPQQALLQQRKYYEMLLDNIRYLNNTNKTNTNATNTSGMFDILRGKAHTCLLYSKLRKKQWPNVNDLRDKLLSFVDDCVNECIQLVKEQTAKLPVKVRDEYYQRLEAFQYNADDFQRENKVKEIERQYNAWIERMKIPPLIQRDPMDLDYPQLMDSNETGAGYNYGGSGEHLLQHSRGPYLDIILAKNIDRDAFEKLTLQHFLVCDQRMERSDLVHTNVQNNNSISHSQTDDDLVTPMVSFRPKITT